MSGILENKRALVTGAASGIGASIASALARAGASVAAHARTDARVAPVINAIRAAGGRAIGVSADLEDPAAIAVMCDETVAGLGGIDIIINNAGFAEKAPLTETSDELWQRTLQINLTAPFLICRHLVPALRENEAGGRIIFNASVAAKLPDPYGSAYNASKAGILGLMRCMAAELGPEGITVNTICPGWVDTPMARALHEDMYDGDAAGFEAFYAQSTSANMLGQPIKPEDIADAAVFLASDQARRITAQAYNVCAGLCVG